MIPLKQDIDTDIKSSENWIIGSNSKAFKHINREEINIVISERNIHNLTLEINQLLQQDLKFRSSGDIHKIINEITTFLTPDSYQLLIEDIKEVLNAFNTVTNTNEFRLLLATVNTNLCRRFHTDINDLRLLCTYSGPGTLWLSDDNINQEALNNYHDNANIVINENKIKQVKTGALVLLKGALFPNKVTKAAVHRSPTIEESGQKRLLLRIDTNNTLNF